MGESLDTLLLLIISICSGNDPALRETPDIVEAFCPKLSSVTINFTDSSGQTHDWNIIMDVSNRDTQIDLYQALDCLPAQDKTYIILHYFEEMSFGEIAEVVKKSEAAEAAVQSLLS